MSCSTPRTKAFMRREDSSSDVEIITEKNRTNPDATYDMSQTICLFKKYLTRSQQNKRKSNMEDSEVFKRRTSRPLLPPKFGYNLNRSASFLEQKLLPVLRYIFFFHLLIYLYNNFICKKESIQLLLMFIGLIHYNSILWMGSIQHHNSLYSTMELLMSMTMFLLTRYAT